MCGWYLIENKRIYVRRRLWKISPFAQVYRWNNSTAAWYSWIAIKIEIHIFRDLANKYTCLKTYSIDKLYNCDKF